MQEDHFQNHVGMVHLKQIVGGGKRNELVPSKLRKRGRGNNKENHLRFLISNNFHIEKNKVGGLESESLALYLPTPKSWNKIPHLLKPEI